MRRILPYLFVFLSVACTSDDAGDTGDATTFCADLASANEGCWTPELDGECRDRFAECGEEILVMESCPVQLGCS